MPRPTCGLPPSGTGSSGPTNGTTRSSSGCGERSGSLPALAGLAGNGPDVGGRGVRVGSFRLYGFRLYRVRARDRLHGGSLAVTISSQRQVAAAGGVEDVHRPGIYPELGVLALSDVGGGVEPGDNGFAAGVRASRVPGQLLEFGAAHPLPDLARE